MWIIVSYNIYNTNLQYLIVWISYMVNCNYIWNKYWCLSSPLQYSIASYSIAAGYMLWYGEIVEHAKIWLCMLYFIRFRITVDKGWNKMAVTKRKLPTILENVALKQLEEHLVNNELMDVLQTGYQEKYSTETALLKVKRIYLHPSMERFMSLSCLD